MPEAIKFKFQQTGQKDVENAFKSIEKTSNQSSKAVIKDAEAQAKSLQKLSEAAKKAAKDLSDVRVKQSKKDTEEILKDYQKQVLAAKDAAKQIKEAFKDAKDAKNPKKEKEVNYGEIKSLYANVKGMLGGAALTSVALSLGTVGVAARESLQLQEMANRISISSRGYGETAVDPSQLRRGFEATATATPGTKAEDVASAVGAFVSKTGDIKTAVDMQNTWATAASATGAKMEDLANVSAALMDKFDIKSVKDMQDAFAKLTFQGKSGAFEIKDAAALFDKLTAAAGRFNIGKGQYAVATLGGLTQMARKSTGSSEEAATATEAMLANLVGSAGKLKGKGVDVFDPKTGASRNITDVLVDTISKVGGTNQAQKKIQLGEIFGKEGIRGISTLMSAQETAFMATKKAGGTDAEAAAAGIKAMRDEINKNINAQSRWSEVQKDAGQAQQNVSAQLTHAWESIKSTVSSSALPAISKLITDFGGLDKASDTLANVLLELVESLITILNAIKPWLITFGLVKNPNQTVHFDLAQKYQKEANESRQKIMDLTGKPGELDKLLKTDPKEWARRQQEINALNSKEKTARAIELKEADLAISKEETPEFVMKKAFPERYLGEKKGTESRKIEEENEALNKANKFGVMGAGDKFGAVVDKFGAAVDKLDHANKNAPLGSQGS